MGEVLEEAAELAEPIEVHDVGVVEDGDEKLGFVVEFPGGFDEGHFAVGVTTGRLEAEGFAEDLDGAGVGVGAGDGRGDDLLWVVGDEGKHQAHELEAGEAFAGQTLEHVLLVRAGVIQAVLSQRPFRPLGRSWAICRLCQSGGWQATFMGDNIPPVYNIK